MSATPTWRRSFSANGSKRRRSLSLETLEDRLLLATDFYAIDGSGNNLDNPDWGSTDTQLLRLTSADYGDGVSSPAGEDRPSPREVSNAVVAQEGSIANDRYLTDIVWLWGQFIDHDIDLTENADPAEPLDIEVPTGDPFFDPLGTGTETIAFNRSVNETDEDGVRQQLNQITAFLDGSIIYGSDEERAAALRTFTGGMLKTSEGDLLPFNEEGLANAGGPSADLFLAGDVRANENTALTAMQTLWVREHNYWAEQIASENPALTDEEIYQEARGIVIAELQAITYNQFLPALLGEDAIAPYSGYDDTVNPGIANVFSTASYRFGHSMLSSELLRLNNDGSVSEAGNLPLSEAFFAPQEITDHGIDSLLLGATEQRAQEIDTMLVDDVRNFLFGPPGSGGFDLASLNIQRGRDHGLPSYNQARIDLGLQPASDFADITSDPETQAKLEAVYGEVDNVDVWVGALAEDHVPGASVGELNYTVLVDQFTRLRDGDRFWYENIYSGEELETFQNTTLADVIERNTNITDLRDNVFYDDAVLYHKSEYGGGPEDLTLSTVGNQIRIIDNDTGEVLESRPADEVEQVHLVGQDNVNDRFVIDFNGEAELADDLLVHGGQQDRDALIVRGTSQSDDITVGPEAIQVDEATIMHSGIDRLVIQARAGDDHIVVSEDFESMLTVFGGPGNDTLIDPNHVARFIPGSRHERGGNHPGHGHHDRHRSDGFAPALAALDHLFASRLLFASRRR